MFLTAEFMYESRGILGLFPRNHSYWRYFSRYNLECSRVILNTLHSRKTGQKQFFENYAKGRDYAGKKRVFHVIGT